MVTWNTIAADIKKEQPVLEVPNIVSKVVLEPCQPKVEPESGVVIPVEVSPEPVAESKSVSQISIQSGQWSPVLRTPNSNISVSVKSGRFTQIGNLVTAFFDITVSAPLTDITDGAVFLDGLPTPGVDDPGIVGGATVYYHNHFRSRIYQITGTVSGGSSQLQLWRAVSSESPLNHLLVRDLQNISTLTGSIQYTAAI